MTSACSIGLFAEDRAHEAFLSALLGRLVREEQVTASVGVHSARGGHGRALAELRLYRRLLEHDDRIVVVPDILVVGIDGNCTTAARKRREIHEVLGEELGQRLVAACPDPHVERWYLADPPSFHETVGPFPRMARRKCARDYYKSILVRAVVEAGHPPTLGGIEFAGEIAESMDLYRASQADSSLKLFIRELKAKLRLYSA